MDRFNMADDELRRPGTFTVVFWCCWSLDVRGTVRPISSGVRRLDNLAIPNAYWRLDRVDIVRGPASPIYGPSKIGGYLNFKPETARIEETGSYIEERLARFRIQPAVGTRA